MKLAVMWFALFAYLGVGGWTLRDGLAVVIALAFGMWLDERLTSIGSSIEQAANQFGGAVHPTAEPGSPRDGATQ